MRPLPLGPGEVGFLTVEELEELIAGHSRPGPITVETKVGPQTIGEIDEAAINKARESTCTHRRRPDGRVG